MPKARLKRFLPDSQKVRSHKHIRLFGSLLLDPNIWHLNRKSVSGALAVGLFVAFIPLPAQMLIAAAAAIVLRVNLPIASLTVWITNPITMPIFFYFAYVVGNWILGVPVETEQSGFSIDRVLNSLGKPFILGCFVMGTLSAIIGFVSARLYWRWFVIKQWSLRRKGKNSKPPKA